MTLAPIVIFVYNRPKFTRQTLEALSQNELASESDLFIYADGPKENASQKDIDRIKEVRTLLREKKWCRSVTIIESEKNKGLAASVINGVTEIVNKFGKIIVVEDDVITSRYFLRFMNEALNKYENESKVLSTGSWNYYFPCTYSDTFFTHLPDTIAWATWKRAWDMFESDSKLLLHKLKEEKLLDYFNLNGNFDYEGMLKKQIENKVSSWAIRWTAVAVLQKTLTLYPSRSLSKHIGFGNDSTHVKSVDYNADLSLSDSAIKLNDIFFIENTEAVNSWIDFEKNIIPLKISYKKRLAHVAKKTINPLLRLFNTGKYGWSGNYSSWEEAKKNCTGYDSSLILEKVLQSTLKIKNGEAVYERDSVLFDKIEFSFPLLNALNQIATENRKKISVADFGGSLGSSYFQNKKILDTLSEVRWNVIEQSGFVTAGKKYIEDQKLKFHNSIDSVINSTGIPDLLLISCTIQYIEKPYELLNELSNKKIKYILIDNTPFNFKKADRITKQVVPPHIYIASYPCWFLDYEKVKTTMSEQYEVINEYKNELYIYLDGKKINYRGMLLKLK
ncbi:MAG: methyltransferase, TIGR04325 family [Bacteroidota bacterium]